MAFTPATRDALASIFARMAAEAPKSAEEQLSARAESMTPDDEFERALRRLFGIGHGDELYRRGDAAALGEIETRITRMERDRRADAFNLLNLKALHRAARIRIERRSAIGTAAE
jgi:hypothetical protein